MGIVGNDDASRVWKGEVPMETFVGSASQDEVRFSFWNVRNLMRGEAN